MDLPEDAFTDGASAHADAHQLVVIVPRRDPEGPAMQVRPCVARKAEATREAHMLSHLRSAARSGTQQYHSSMLASCCAHKMPASIPLLKHPHPAPPAPATPLSQTPPPPGWQPSVQEKRMFNPDHHPVELDITLSKELKAKVPKPT